MNFLLLTPGEFVPVHIELKDAELDTLQEAIKGPIEFIEVTIDGKDYDIIINEVGKDIDLQPSLAMSYGQNVTDVLVGKVLFSKSNEDGNSLSLDENDIKAITSYFENSTKRYFPYISTRIPVLDSLYA